FDYGDALLLFEVRGLVDNEQRGNVPRNVSNEYYMTEGLIREGKFYRHGSSEGEDLAEVDAHVTPGGTFGAFLAAVRSRKPEDNNADAETAHYSAALCHLANISYRLGEQATYDKTRGAIGDNKQVVAAFQNVSDNLKA